VSGWVPTGALAAHFVTARQLEVRERRARLSSGIGALDEALGGGWPRGALSELTGPRGAGRTALLLASLRTAIARGETCALVDATGTLDPWAALRAGLPLDRLLWVRSEGRTVLPAAELVVGAGGFGVVVLDLGEVPPRAPTAAWQRLKRAAEKNGAVVLLVAGQRPQGALGTCALTLQSPRALFDRGATGATPPLLTGIGAQARLERGAAGPAGGAAGPAGGAAGPAGGAAGPAGGAAGPAGGAAGPADRDRQEDPAGRRRGPAGRPRAERADPDLWFEHRL
jgi:hypothetical protein